MKQNDMPKCFEPILIKTKGLPWYKGLYAWLTARRLWRFNESWCMPYLDGFLCVPKGYVFNGASVPRIFWWLFSPELLLFIPSIFHDMAYTKGYVLMKKNVGGEIYKGAMDKRGADKLFRDIGIELNGLPWVHWFIYVVLYLFAGYAWRRCEQTRGRA